jgi:hypothetical protein
MNPARDTSGWPAHDVVPPVKLVPSNVVCAEQQTCIDIANAAIRLLEHFKLDIERGGMVAAEKSRHEVFEMVRQLGPAWLECWEKLTGCAAGMCEHGEVVELCQACGDICFGEEA